MPFINFDASSTTLIDAQLSLSFTQLTELLKVLIDQTNGHEQRIQDMSSHISGLQRRNEELEKQLQQMGASSSGGGASTSSLVEELAMNVQLLRDDVHLLKKNSRAADGLQSDMEQLTRNLASDRQSTSVAFSTVQEKWSQLSQQVNRCQTEVGSALAFQKLWGAAAEDVNRAVEANHHTPESAKSFILALPAMEHLLGEIAVGAARRKSSVEDNEFVLQREWNSVVSVLREDMEQVRQQLLDAQRIHRLAEGTEGRLKEIDEKLRVLDATKADHLSLSGKTDKETTANVAQKLNGVIDELGELTERINSGGGDAPKRSSTNQGTAPDDLRKRVAALEAETTALETKKADRSELMKLYEAMDALTRNSPLGLQTMPSSHDGSPQPPKVKPPSAKSRSTGSLLDHVAVMDSHLPPVDFASIVGSNRINSASPRRGTTPSRPLFVGRSTVGVRDSSGGMTPASITCSSR